MEKKVVYVNEKKIDQGYYDPDGNFFILKPGQKKEFDVSKRPELGALIQDQFKARQTELAIEEQKRVKRQLAFVRAAKTEEELDLLKIDEKSNEVLEAILVKYKELTAAEVKDESRGVKK